MEEELLNGDFQMYPSFKEYYRVSLTREAIRFEEKAARKASTTVVLLWDVIGCKIYQRRDKKDGYPVVKIVAMVKNKKSVREERTYTFRVSTYNDRQGNMAIAEIWTRTILWLIRVPNIASDDLQEKDTLPDSRRFFIFINPKSGKGESVSLFHSKVEVYLKEAGVTYDLLVTEYAGHCTEFAKTYDFTQYDMVVICSGDGLLNEYFNGIFNREDWEAVLGVPVSILPTGSGNALAASVLHHSKEEAVLSNSIFVMLRGKAHPLDIFSIENKYGRQFAFLSVTWGMLSDIDIESEKFRCLGATRFTLGFIQKLLTLRHYKGKLEYLDAAPGVRKDKGTIPKDERLSIQHNERQESTVNIKEVLKGPRSTIPNLTENIPSTWTKVDTEFIVVTMSSISHLGIDMFTCPGALFNDGMINLQYVEKGLSKSKLLEMFLKLEHGTHLTMPELTLRNIYAFRLTPGNDNGKGHVAVDGEEVNYGPIQGEVYSSLAKVIVIEPT